MGRSRGRPSRLLLRRHRAAGLPAGAGPERAPRPPPARVRPTTRRRTARRIRRPWRCPRQPTGETSTRHGHRLRCAERRRYDRPEARPPRRLRQRHRGVAARHRRTRPLGSRRGRGVAHLDPAEVEPVRDRRPHRRRQYQHDQDPREGRGQQAGPPPPARPGPLQPPRRNGHGHRDRLRDDLRQHPLRHRQRGALGIPRRHIHPAPRCQQLPARRRARSPPRPSLALGGGSRRRFGPSPGLLSGPPLDLPLGTPESAVRTPVVDGAAPLPAPLQGPLLRPHTFLAPAAGDRFRT